MNLHQVTTGEAAVELVKGLGTGLRPIPNILMVGPPGNGATMLARRIASNLDPVRGDCAVADRLRRIYADAGLTGMGERDDGDLNRPFRAPHHTCSRAALVGIEPGADRKPRPGEVTLAYRGVLFLDALMEFRMSTVQAVVDACQSAGDTPATVIAHTSLCPCGHGRPSGKVRQRRSCRCTGQQVIDRMADLATWSGFFERVCFVDLDADALEDLNHNFPVSPMRFLA